MEIILNVSSLIFAPIHISTLITTPKKKKKKNKTNVSLLSNVGLNILLTPYFPYELSYYYI